MHYRHIEIMLSSLYHTFSGLRPQVSDPLEQLSLLARMYLCEYRRLLAGATTFDGHPETDGELQACRDKSHAFCDVLRARAEQTADTVERCRLLSLLHDVEREIHPVSDARRRSRWETLVIGTLEDYFGHAAAKNTPAGDAAACLCIADFYYCAPPDEGEDDEWWPFLQGCLGDWSVGYRDATGWADTDLLGALERLRVLNRYSYMYLDSRYDGTIGKACRRYAGLLAGDAIAWSPAIACLTYDLSVEGNACPRDASLARRAAGELAKALEQKTSNHYTFV